MLFDLHVHSSYSSCSRLKPQEILRHASGRGLAGVCITDHHTTAVRRELKEGIQPDGLCLIFGMEYTTPEGDFLVFGPFDDLPAGLSAALLLKLVRKAEGVAIAAHPFRTGRTVDEHLIRDGRCRMVEGINGRNSWNQNRGTGQWRNNYGVFLTGGSDAHSLDELGSVTTRLTVPVRSRADLVRALRRKHFIEVVPEPSAAEPEIKPFQKEPLMPRGEGLGKKPSYLPQDCVVPG